MIFLCTNARDITSDYIVLELQRRGIAYVRLNTERLPDATVQLGFESPDDWSIKLGDREFRGLEISAAYFRRPGIPDPPPEIVDLEHRKYCVSEWAACLRALYGRLDGKWLNSPTKIGLAEDKPLQLLLAAKLGFEIPATLVSNEPAAFEQFLKGGPTVGKPLRHALLAGAPDRIIFTSRLEPLLRRDPRAIAAAPLILQREITKCEDIRVTVVGENVFAVAIDSQADVEAETDWRRGDSANLLHEAIDLPPNLARLCIELTQALGLRFGAIDLIRDVDFQFWFLEINPNGQWAWIENRTGLPISAAIVDELCRIGGL